MRNLFKHCIVLIFILLFTGCMGTYSPTKFSSDTKPAYINYEKSTLYISESFFASEDKKWDYIRLGNCVDKKSRGEKNVGAVAVTLTVNKKEQKYLYKCPSFNFKQDYRTYDFTFNYIPKKLELNLAQVLLPYQFKPENKDINVDVKVDYFTSWGLKDKESNTKDSITSLVNDLKKGDFNKIVNDLTKKDEVKKKEVVVKLKYDLPVHSFSNKFVIKKNKVDNLFVPHWYINESLKVYKKTRNFKKTRTVISKFAKRVKQPAHLKKDRIGNEYYKNKYAVGYYQKKSVLTYKNSWDEKNEFKFYSPYFLPIAYKIYGQDIFHYFAKKGNSGFVLLTWYYPWWGVDRFVTDEKGNTYAHKYIHKLDYEKIKDYSKRFYLKYVCEKINSDNKNCLDILVDKKRRTTALKLLSENTLPLGYYNKKDITKYAKRGMNKTLYNKEVLKLSELDEIIKKLEERGSYYYSHRCRYKISGRYKTSYKCKSKKNEVYNKIKKEKNILKKEYSRHYSKIKRSFGLYERINFNDDLKSAKYSNSISTKKIKDMYPYITTNINRLVERDEDYAYNKKRKAEEKARQKTYNNIITAMNQVNKSLSQSNNFYKKTYPYNNYSNYNYNTYKKPSSSYKSKTKSSSSYKSKSSSSYKNSTKKSTLPTYRVGPSKEQLKTQELVRKRQLEAQRKKAAKEKRVREQQEREARAEQKRRELAKKKKELAAKKKELARKKAEEKRLKKQREEQARRNYLAKMKSGIRLGAKNCYGEHHVGGKRPRIKPQVVSCIDVSFNAYCRGDSRSRVSGILTNFTGFDAGCFGDTKQVRKLNCKASEYIVRVTDVRRCR